MPLLGRSFLARRPGSRRAFLFRAGRGFFWWCHTGILVVSHRKCTMSSIIGLRVTERRIALWPSMMSRHLERQRSSSRLRRCRRKNRGRENSLQRSFSRNLGNLDLLHFPQLLLRLPLHGGTSRVLHFEPVRGAPRAVRRVLALRHAAFEARGAALSREGHRSRGSRPKPAPTMGEGRARESPNLAAWERCTVDV
jgi:hypothetical protein